MKQAPSRLLPAASLAALFVLMPPFMGVIGAASG